MPRYFIATLIYFWAPVAAMGAFLWPRMDGSARKAFWITIAVFYPLAFGMEYVYLYFDVWTFSEKLDPLLGIRIWGAPIEEFCFWFGAPPFVMLLYMIIHRLLRRYTAAVEELPLAADAALLAEPEAMAGEMFPYWAGAWFPAWGTLFLPFLIAFWYLYHATRKRVDWKSAAATTVLFEGIVFPAEVYSVHRGHWVYNDARIWGPRWFGVPIEEPLLYYLFAPLIVITAMHAARMALRHYPHRKIR